MFSTADKTHHAAASQQKAAAPTFFRKAGEGSFFGGGEVEHRPSFFGAPVQAKLSVSSPDDPQEKEADAVASQVMRMPDPVASPEKKEEETIHKKEEDKDEKLHTKPETSPISIRAKCESCEKEDKAQAKLFRSIQRYADAVTSDAADDASSDYIIDRKPSLYRSDIIQLSGRGPPQTSVSFEQNLSTSKGAGSPLPETTKDFMESRFNADFSGVRVHTGSYAENLSGQISAQAFAHGNDIYFNSGKYSPHTEAGGTLLAHELTHTIQQGASPSNTQNAVSKKTIARKNIIQRSAAAVPAQLTSAVDKAKTVEGKIDANKAGPDGNRTGWEHLVEIFKSTFGEEMIVHGGAGTSVKGAVAEDDIKKKREQHGVMVVDKTTVTDHNAIAKTTTGSRDAMPSWCGIFVFWALNKSGVPMPKWKLGERMIKPEAARTPGAAPLPGDIAYRNAFSHFAIVAGVNGGTVTTVNGNTAGEDNLGGQVQTKDHPLTEWTAFFDPLKIMTGSLGQGEQAANPIPKTLAELRKEKLHVDAKQEEEHKPEEANIQTKPELSNCNVDGSGSLHTNQVSIHRAAEEELQKKDEEPKEEDKETASPVHQLQKKQSEAFDNEEPAQEISSESSAEGQVHAKTEADSSLTNSDDETRTSLDVRERGPPVQCKTEKGIQRSVIDDALQYTSLGVLLDCVQITDIDATSICLLRKARDVAMHIPGYRALRVVLGKDPITGERVERNGHNFLEAAFDIMPGGTLLHRKLDEQHQLDAAAAWIDGKIADLESIVDGLFTEFDRFWNDLGITDFRSPMTVISNGAGIVLRFINNLIRFAVNAAMELLEMVKQYLLEKIVDFIKEHTTAYPLLTVILGEDPITKQRVARNGTNILNALLELGGEEGRQQRQQMMETGTYQKVVGYIDEGIAVFSDLYNTIIQNFSVIWDAVSIDALMNPRATFQRIYETFAAPVRRVLDFVSRVVAEILKLVKEVLFKRISAEAKKVRGYYLVTVLIGKDPFTSERIPRNVENIIHGFMSLMDGGEEQFQQMKESGAIDKATQKIDAAVRRLNMTFESVVQLFIDLWNSFTFSDFLHPIATFQRIIAKFGEPIGRLIAFVVEIIRIVVEVILIIMNFPFDLINNIIAKAMQAIDLIKRDPIGFLKNLLRAIKEGFMQFFDNILTHLFNGLKTWFLGEVQAAGIPIPTDFSVMGIIRWLLAVLDVTMEKIWKKLEERIGKPKVDKIKKMIETAQRVANAAGEAYQFMQDVQQRGFMAVMIDKVKEQLSNVWEMVLDAVKSFVMDQIIKKVTAKLLNMLDPTGIMAVVNSAIALYKAIQSFIRYLRQMLEIVNSFVEGTLQIAQGATKKAADFLEGALARGIPIVIGFLANQVGLNLSERLRDALELVRDKVDKALTWVIDKLVVIVEKIVSFGKAAIASILKWLGLKKEFSGGDGKPHKLYFSGSEDNPVLMVQSNPTAYATFISSLNVGEDQAKKTAKEQAVPIAESIDAKRTAPLAGTTEEEKEKSKEEKLKEVEKLLSDLSVPTAVLFGDPGAAGEPEVVNTTQTAGHAITMTAKKLNKKQTLKGSPPTSANTTSFATLNTRRQSASASYYVKGHMLNDNIGGKGVWENLTPLSREGNSNHEGNVESLVKAAYNSGAIVEYNVTAEYGYGNNAASIPADDPKRDEKLKIIAEEKNVPTKLKCDAWILEKKGDAFERKQSIVSTPVANPIGQDAASYVLEGSPAKPDVFLNTSDVSVIATVEGFTASLAVKVELAHSETGKKRFNSYAELSNAKMKDGSEVFDAGEKAKLLAASSLNYVKLYKITAS